MYYCIYATRFGGGQEMCKANSPDLALAAAYVLARANRRARIQLFRDNTQLLDFKV